MGTPREASSWLATAQAQLLRGELAAARATLAQALVEHPESVDLRRALAGALQQAGQDAGAESLLRALLDENPADAASAFALARILTEQGRTATTAAVLRACFAAASNHGDPNLAIRAIELLDDCDRKVDAAAIAETAIAANPRDPRLHAYAGMLQVQLGEFGQARQHYLFALEHDERAWEWHVPIGLSSAQHYDNPEHADFEVFKHGLQHQTLSEQARAELHFALGKACDNAGDYEQAAQHFRAGNVIAHRLTKWSRKTWRRAVEARLASEPIQSRIEPSVDFTPVYIVGMPRSGTTLLAVLLSRYPEVCNRGEQPWLARLALQRDLSGRPGPRALEDAVARYIAHVRQDDAGDARWFIDKQPLNFRYVDLMLALFPDARIIHCQRGARDTALSLWMQCFLEDVQGYAYDFADIAAVMRDDERLMAHWRNRYPNAIRTVEYERLVAAPGDTVADLATWVGMRPAPANRVATDAPTGSVISTASLWQARQPVNARSVGRWKPYAQYVPELLRFGGDS